MAARLMASGNLPPEALDAARQRIAMRSFGTARDVAEAVCFLASDSGWLHFGPNARCGRRFWDMTKHLSEKESTTSGYEAVRALMQRYRVPQMIVM